MTDSVATAIFEKRSRFLGVFLVTAVIGVLLISVSVSCASREREVIHEVDNMSRMVRAMLGEKAMDQLVRGEHPLARGDGQVLADPGYRLFIVSDRGLTALQSGADDDLRVLESIDLEATRINERGGYFEADGAIRTWVRFQDGEGSAGLLVVHRVRGACPTASLASCDRGRVEGRGPVALRWATMVY